VLFQLAQKQCLSLFDVSAFLSALVDPDLSLMQLKSLLRLSQECLFVDLLPKKMFCVKNDVFIDRMKTHFQRQGVY